MILHCPSRRCNTTRDHKLKVETNDAVCMDCGESNNVVSSFMKSAMKASGEIYRSVSGKKAFMYKCPKCTVDRGVKVVDELALCDTCGHPLNLSSPMIEAIKTTAAKDVTRNVSALSEEAVIPNKELKKGVVKRRAE